MAAIQIAEKATPQQGSQSMWWTALGFHLPYMLMAASINAPVVWPAIFLAATGVVVSLLLFALIRKQGVYSCTNAASAGLGWAMVLAFAAMPGQHRETAFPPHTHNQQKQVAPNLQP